MLEVANLSFHPADVLFYEADLPHLFERFYRGAGFSKDSAGIGLALAKSIIEKENGTVTAKNTETTQFLIILPNASLHHPKSPESEIPSAPRIPKRHP